MFSMQSTLTLGLSLNIQKCISMPFYQSYYLIVFDYYVIMSNDIIVKEFIRVENMFDLGQVFDIKKKYFLHLENF